MGKSARRNKGAGVTALQCGANAQRRKEGDAGIHCYSGNEASMIGFAGVDADPDSKKGAKIFLCYSRNYPPCFEQAPFRLQSWLPKTMLTQKPRVTMREIADRCGVSHATVSLALRDHPRISQKLRKKIRAIALEMGYQPDPLLTALSHYRHHRTHSPVQAAIAWLNCWPNPKELRSFGEYDFSWKGASEGAKKYGYRLEEFVVDKEMPLHRLEKVLITRNIKGILIPPHRNNLSFEGFNWEHFSVVRLGRTVQSPEMHVVTSDQSANAMLAFRKVREKGYQRIGYIGGDAPQRLFTAGFLQSQLSLPKTLRLPLLLFPHGEPPNSRQVIEWIKKQRPQAIVTDLSELPALLAKAGYRVPQDFALVGLSQLDGNISACIDQHALEIGRVAVLMVISQIHDFAQGIPAIFRQILVEGTWVDGPSCPPLPSS